MKLNFKIIGKILFGVFIVATMIVFGLFAYVSRHKEVMLQKIQQQFNSTFNGTLHINDIEPSIWKQFPNLSFVLKNVTIRDRNWHLHHHDLLQVEKLYVQIKLIPLLTGQFQIRKFILSKGSAYLFEDKNGINNSSLFKKRKESNQNSNELKLRRLEIENFDFYFEHYHRKKNFAFHVSELHTWIDLKKEIRNFHTKGNIVVNNLIFNTSKGSFIKGKSVLLDVYFSYNSASKELIFDKQLLDINKEKVSFSATFNLDSTKQNFDLYISSPSIHYREGLTWLSPNIRNPLDSFMIENPISIDISIAGKLNNQPNPWVKLKSRVSNNTVLCPFGKFDSVNFLAEYNNGRLTDTIYGDIHSSIKLHQLSASYKQIRFTADSTYVFNLIAPSISTIIRGEFAINKLNNILAKKSFLFGKGNARINLKYVGSISKKNDTTADIDGDINIKNADVTYLPRQLNFHHCNINLHLHNQDIEIQNSQINTAKSSISFNAQSKNFLGLYIKHPELVLFDAQVYSKQIDLNEFQNFLSKRKIKSQKKIKTKSNSLPDAIDKTLDVSSTILNIKLDRIVYKKFDAQNISAQVSILPNAISINNVQLNHAKGLIQLSGTVYEKDEANNAFSINTKIIKVAVDKLLYSFGNFGQYTFLPENIKGVISLNSKLNGLFNDKGQFILGSLHGTTAFQIEQGELIQFKPLIRMGKMIFRKKRLENIHFATVKNTLSINGNNISIPPMFIKSDLISLQIAGIFNLDKGTNLDIEIPLFKTDESNTNSGMGIGNGYKIYVKGQDDEQGNIHFKWKLKNKEVAAAREERRKNRKLRKNRANL